MQNPTRQLTLNKGSQTFIFRYTRGQENEVLNALDRQAKDCRIDFDWFDAAILRLKLPEQ